MRYLIGPSLVPAWYPKSFNRNVPLAKSNESPLLGVIKTPGRNRADVGHG